MPDEAALVPQWKYIKPAQATWPKADFIVGNPPFIGDKRLRIALGDGYVEALRSVWKEVPKSADFVMHWWSRAAALVVSGSARRFGLITTNSLRQTFNRRVVQAALDQGVALTFAIPDHPWVDSANGAAVRIAMTVANLGSDPSPKGAGSDPNFADPSEQSGRLLTVASEETGEFGEVNVTLLENNGLIHADLCIGADASAAMSLQANVSLACPGAQLSAQGFILSPSEAVAMRSTDSEKLIKRYLTGKDLTQNLREQYVIDTFGLDLETLRTRHPTAFQWLNDRVRPERESKRNVTKDSIEYADRWWLFSKSRPKFRMALADLKRFVVTSRTARHRVFQFIESSFLPETKVLILAFAGGFELGVLSSSVHVTFANRVGGWLGVGNDSTYNHTACFETFPFPDQDTGLTPALRGRIAQLAEQIDAHRKRQQAAHPGLTLTGMYNVLEILRSFDRLRTGGAQDDPSIRFADPVLSLSKGQGERG